MTVPVRPRLYGCPHCGRKAPNWFYEEIPRGGSFEEIAPSKFPELRTFGDDTPSDVVLDRNYYPVPGLIETSVADSFCYACTNSWPYPEEGQSEDDYVEFLKEWRKLPRVTQLGLLFCGRCHAEIAREEAIHGVDVLVICRACAYK